MMTTFGSRPARAPRLSLPVEVVVSRKILGTVADPTPRPVRRQGGQGSGWAADPDRISSMSKSYWIRTFGCQMNEHDSERMAGLLEVQGYRPAPTAEEADVVVFNTCAIRENADNKLYGHLGTMKRLKQERPEMKVVVGGCLAEKDRD